MSRRGRNGKGLVKKMIKLVSDDMRKGRANMWQLNAGTNHGGRKKHKGILGF